MFLFVGEDRAGQAAPVGRAEAAVGWNRRNKLPRRFSQAFAKHRGACVRVDSGPARRSAVSRRMGKAFYIESVEEAASIAGGYDRLAAALGVSIEEVESWS